MKKQQVSILIAVFLFLLSGGELEAQRTFSYGEKYCGQYDLNFSLDNDAKKEISDIVIDFNEIKKDKIKFTIELDNLVLGLEGSDCKDKSKKSKAHNKSYYIELDNRFPNKKSGLIKWTDWSDISVGNVNNKGKWVQKATFTGSIDIASVKKKEKKSIKIKFQVNNEEGKVEEIVVGLELTLLPKKIEEKETAETTAIDTTKKNLTTISNSVISKTEREKIQWEKIQAALDKKEFNLVTNLAYEYRDSFDTSYSHYEEVWYYSIKYPSSESNKEMLCKRYFQEILDGTLKKQVTKICYRPKKKSTKEEAIQELDYWEKRVLTKNTPEYFQKYLTKYGSEATFSFEAEQKVKDFVISEQKRSEHDSISFMMQYSYSGNEMIFPEITILEGAAYILDTIRPTMVGVNVRLQMDKSARLIFAIPDSPWKTDTVEIDASIPPLYARLVKDEINKIIIFEEIKNGKSPYRIELINADNGVIVRHYEVLKVTQGWPFRYDTLSQLVTGNYKLRLKDKTGINNFISDDFFVEITTPKPWWMFFLPAVILSLLAGLLLHKWKKKGADVSVGEGENKVTPTIHLPEVVNKQTSEENESIRQRITVHGKRAVVKNNVSLTTENLLAEGIDYRLIDLNYLWVNSTISTLFIHPKCIEQINDFAFKNADNYLLPKGEMPEIGGFLLGRYAEENGIYEVALEEFISIESENSNVYQISFGAKAWSKLEKEMKDEKNQAYKLIGWFHTHPGHGLFLSRPDLNIHQNFFNQPFQIAMEIDNVKSDRNPTFDVAFFTQQDSSKVNNVKELKDKWFQWMDIWNDE